MYIFLSIQSLQRNVIGNINLLQVKYNIKIKIKVKANKIYLFVDIIKKNVPKLKGTLDNKNKENWLTKKGK